MIKHFEYDDRGITAYIFCAHRDCHNLYCKTFPPDTELDEFVIAYLTTFCDECRAKYRENKDERS